MFKHIEEREDTQINRINASQVDDMDDRYQRFTEARNDQMYSNVINASKRPTNKVNYKSPTRSSDAKTSNKTKKV